MAFDPNTHPDVATPEWWQLAADLAQSGGAAKAAEIMKRWDDLKNTFGNLRVAEPPAQPDPAKGE